jgi:hypothetical protein
MTPAEITLYAASFLFLVVGLYKIHRSRATRRWGNFRRSQDAHMREMAFRKAKQREGDRNWNN